MRRQELACGPPRLSWSRRPRPLKWKASKRAWRSWSERQTRPRGRTTVPQISPGRAPRLYPVRRQRRRRYPRPASAARRLTRTSSKAMAENAQPSADRLADSPSSRISVLEIARRLNVGRLAVYSMLEQGIIPGVRLGRRWIITRHAYLAPAAVGPALDFDAHQR